MEGNNGALTAAGDQVETLYFNNYLVTSGYLWAEKTPGFGWEKIVLTATLRGTVQLETQQCLGKKQTLFMALLQQEMQRSVSV